MNKTAQTTQYRKGFWWGKIEHKLESYTTTLLCLGLALQLIGILTQQWLMIMWMATPIIMVSLVFRALAGFSHFQEKKYMDPLRFGRAKKANGAK